MKRILVLKVLHHEVEKIKITISDIRGKLATAIDTGSTHKHDSYYKIIASNVELTKEQVDYIYENDPNECKYREYIETEEPLVAFK